MKKRHCSVCGKSGHNARRHEGDVSNKKASRGSIPSAVKKHVDALSKLVHGHK